VENNRGIHARPAQSVAWHAAGLLFHLVQEMGTHNALSRGYWCAAEVVAEAKLRGEPLHAMCAWYDSFGGDFVLAGEAGSRWRGGIGWVACSPGGKACSKVKLEIGKHRDAGSLPCKPSPAQMHRTIAPWPCAATSP
jgi:hypothetical protein